MPQYLQNFREKKKVKRLLETTVAVTFLTLLIRILQAPLKNIYQELMVLNTTSSASHKFCEKGNCVWFNDFHCAVEDTRPMTLIIFSCSKASLNDAWLWHHKLGHARMHTLHKLVKHDLLRATSFQVRKGLCDASVKG